MVSGFLEWVGRVAMLVLAGMVTLSIIGSIASIPSESFESRVGLPQRSPIPEQADPEPPLPESISQRADPDASQAEGEATTGTSVIAPVLPEPVGPERWLEAITYALLALAGLAALNALLLWRSLLTRRRMADSLEELTRAARRR